MIHKNTLVAHLKNMWLGVFTGFLQQNHGLPELNNYIVLCKHYGHATMFVADSESLFTGDVYGKIYDY